MPRAWVWVQLLIGWLPMWALFTVMMMAAHESTFDEVVDISTRHIVLAALLGVGVHRLTARWPWPHPFRLRFLAGHLLAAGAYALCWVALNSAVQSVHEGHAVIIVGPGIGRYLIMGTWLYAMIAAVAYANREAERGAQLAAAAARSQLAALRAQLHPHFLFNALHTVVQLIPIDPRGAVRAAELLAGVLRTATEERSELLSLREEWAFVQRYLEIEAIRFGERLVVRESIEPAALDARLPSFALQTLVENAVRHGATPSIGPTELRISARLEGGQLLITVDDNGEGADPAAAERSSGTGLRRLRERLNWLYGGSASLQLRGRPGGGGFGATLQLPPSALPNTPGDDDE